MTHRRLTPVVATVAHACLQALLCSALWAGFALFGGESLLALGVVGLGCVVLGALSSLLRRGRFEAGAAVLLVSFVALTLFFRVSVQEFVGGPPHHWIAFRKTVAASIPYAIIFALLTLAGWHGTRALLRSREPERSGVQGDA